LSLFRRVVCAVWLEELLSAILEMDFSLLFFSPNIYNKCTQVGSETHVQKHSGNGEGLRDGSEGWCSAATDSAYPKGMGINVFLCHVHTYSSI